MKDQDVRYEKLYMEYVERFGEKPEWNLAPPEQQISDMEEALRLNRPNPPEDVPDSIRI